MRWMIGVAAFLAPVVLVVSAVAQAPGAEAARVVVQQSAAFIIDRIA